VATEGGGEEKVHQKGKPRSKESTKRRWSTRGVVLSAIILTTPSRETTTRRTGSPAARRGTTVTGRRGEGGRPH